MSRLPSSSSSSSSSRGSSDGRPSAGTPALPLARGGGGAHAVVGRAGAAHMSPAAVAAAPAPGAAEPGQNPLPPPELPAPQRTPTSARRSLSGGDDGAAALGGWGGGDRGTLPTRGTPPPEAGPAPVIQFDTLPHRRRPPTPPSSVSSPHGSRREGRDGKQQHHHHHDHHRRPKHQLQRQRQQPQQHGKPEPASSSLPPPPRAEGPATRSSLRTAGTRLPKRIPSSATGALSSNRATTDQQPRPKPPMGVRRMFQDPGSLNFGSGAGPSHKTRAAFEHFFREITPAHARRKKDRHGKQRLGPSSIFEVYATEESSVASAPGMEFDLGEQGPGTFTGDHRPPMSSEEYHVVVGSVKAAIDAGIYPERISQGSSGSYFCRNTEGEVVGVFKPKNEEPYGHLNPKWAKWIHRNCFPCCFGRSCLIPNLGYISEAAASLVDRRLGFNIVPRTEVIFLSCPSFYYSYMDRRAARDPRKPKPLPAKIGSFQIFLRGYKDANIFLREHPWPENKASRSAGSSLASLASSVTGNRNANVGEEASLLDRSVRVSMESDLEAGGVSRQHQGTRSRHGSAVPTTEFEWTPEIILQFQVQFEKLVILDYLMRNTDRGLDNWMVKYCGSGWTNCRSPQPDGSVGVDSDDFPLSDEGTPILNADGRYAESPSDSLGATTTRPIPPVASEPQLYAEITSSTTEAGDKASLAAYAKPHIHIAAIDNGLAFPWKHPDRWRSYPYGWLYLSPSLTKRPFSQETRDAVLPILTSPQWWRETVGELRRLFALDSDFQEDMFERQAAILKGQGWNIVEALRRPGASPVHLVNRVAVAVWAEEVVTLESFDGERFWSYEDEDQDEEDYEPYHSDTTNTTTGGFSDSEGEAYDSRRPQRPPLRPFRRLSADYPPTKHSPSTHAWRQKLKSRMSMDATMFASRYRRRRPTIRKRMTERLEEFTRARPWFTWC